MKPTSRNQRTNDLTRRLEWLVLGAIGRTIPLTMSLNGFTKTNVMNMNARLTFALLLLLGLSAALSDTSTAAIIAQYDGSYNPGDASPPGSNTTWETVNTGGLTFPAASGGSLTLNDNINSGRLSFKTLLSGSPGPVANEAWFFEATLRLNSITGQSFPANSGFIPEGPLFGVRDEGSVSGRNTVLGLDPVSGNLLQVSPSGYRVVNNSNFINSGFRNYRVEKFGVEGTFKIQVYVDNVPQFGTPLDYLNDFPQPLTFGEGVGYYSNTPGLSNVTVDFMALTTGTFVPEPSVLLPLALACGLLAITKLARRRK